MGCGINQNEKGLNEERERNGEGEIAVWILRMKR